MFRKLTLTALLASASFLAVRADVVPSVPGPGVVYNSGATCRIEWDGDKDSNTVWKNMSIQLMTGSNFEMVHLTTVASGQDGTASGFFEHPCPAVTPFSAIYFYQFTSPLATEKTWTTRFTIASPTGATVPPANPTQPGTNAAIPWGVGALADPSTAVPPPAGVDASAPSGSVPGPSSVSSTDTVPATPTVTPINTPSIHPTNSATNTSASHSATPSTSANSTIGTSANNNAALGSATIDSRMWKVAIALGASTMTFALFM
ncbi:hypothetical protein BDZ94DRAFT_1288716 [Collybia nuda]|uniref:Uncharacterized protein n=1 Tax=Collybia nuda TaxID=64659 RepID=A0A9P6CGR1_9AGAR|nr:hypothetical protein BDZ94DRAFT_1288716 [Collybia nuda]